MSTESGRRSKHSWLVPILVIVVAGLLIALILALSREPETSGAVSQSSGTSSTAGPEAQSAQEPDFTVAERRESTDLLTAGPVDAPVVLIVFSDYQCPYCARWNADTLPLMMKHAEAGDLRIEWRDVNVFGPASERAARASYAAAVQGSFWEYHNLLFANGDKRSEGQLSDDALAAAAGDLGLDTDQFVADYGSEETAQAVARNAKLGLDLGANSTPVFILGGQPVVGAQPTQVFADAFDHALSKAE